MNWIPKRFAACAVTLMACVFNTHGQNTPADKAIETLHKRIDGLEETMKQKDQTIEAIRKRLAENAHDEHEEDHGESSIDVSLDVLFSAGTSTERDAVIQQLQAGSHDPNRRGFTLQQAALGVSGQIHDNLRAEAHMIFFIDPEGETKVELEEAFVQNALGDGYQIEGGFFLTEFGLINPQHPHGWAWLDQPIAHSRFLGADGLRQAGFQLSKHSEHHQWHVGIQQSTGETAQSFRANDELYDATQGDRSIGGIAFSDQDTRAFGDFVYSSRFAQSWDLNKQTHATLGTSFLYGPNASGPNGDTIIYGLDLQVEGVGAGPHGVGWTWQTEWLMRDFDTDNANANFVTGDLEDWGLYTQVQYWFDEHWAFGLRYELTGGSGANSNPASPGTAISRDTDPFRADRQRISPMLTWMPNESSRIRLQYNHDDSDHLAESVHTVWFGFEFALGAHGGH